MNAYKYKKIIEKDGEITVTGIPCKKGEKVEMIILIETPDKKKDPESNTKQLLTSKVVGLWKDRDDIEDSTQHARSLRNSSQNRSQNK